MANGIFSISFLGALLIIFGPANVKAEEKTIVVADIKIQGLSIGMTEREAKRIIKNNGYSLVTSSTYGSSFSKKMDGDAVNTIDYKVAVAIATSNYFRPITHISYGQLYSSSTIFDLKQVHSEIQQKFGQANESTFYLSKKNTTINRDTFELKYYNDDQKQDPMLSIKGTMFFSQGSLSVDIYWNGLRDRLNKEYQANQRKKMKSLEKRKEKAIINF